MSVVDRSNRAEVLGGLNPGLRVPTLVLEDGARSESRTRSSGTSATGRSTCPTDRYERAQVLQWQFFEQYSHEPNIAVARFWIAYSRDARGFTDRLPERMKGGYAALDAMEGHLEGRAFLVGDRYSLADISLYAYTHVAHEGGFDLEPYPAIRAWLDRVAAQPGPRARSTTRRVGPRPLRAEPDRVAACRERAHGRRESALRGRAGRSALAADRRHGREPCGRGWGGGDPRTTSPGSASRSTRAPFARAGAVPRIPRRRSGRWSPVRPSRTTTDRFALSPEAPRCFGLTGPRPTNSRRWWTTSSSESRTSCAVTTTGRTSRFRRGSHRALGTQLPEVIHHGLVLGEDGKKLSKRHGHSSIAELREAGFPPAQCGRTSTSSAFPSTTSSSTSRACDGSRWMRSRRCPTRSSPLRPTRRSRSSRLCEAPVRSSRHASTHDSCSSRRPVTLDADAVPTLERFGELRAAAPERLSHEDARGDRA